MCLLYLLIFLAKMFVICSCFFDFMKCCCFGWILVAFFWNLGPIFYFSMSLISNIRISCTYYCTNSSDMLVYSSHILIPYSFPSALPPIPSHCPSFSPFPPSSCPFPPSSCPAPPYIWPYTTTNSWYYSFPSLGDVFPDSIMIGPD